MVTLQREETRRFVQAELEAMRAHGIIDPDEPVALLDGRLTVDGRLRPITPGQAVRLWEAAIIDPDERAELIDGELWLVSPPSDPHEWVIQRLTHRLVLAYGDRGEVRAQMTLRVLGPSLPEPDLTVARPSEVLRRPAGHEVILAVEVAVTSLRRDRRKAALYAEAGVAVFWLVDVEARTVTLHTGPRADGSWESALVVGEDEELTRPEGAGTLRLREVLPPR